LGDNVVATIIGGPMPRTVRLSAVRYVSWASWKTDDATGRLAFDELAGRPPDRRSTGPYDERWSHHAEWYCGTRIEAEEIGERIRTYGDARVQVFEYPTEVGG
jgi:hypothetical protein